MERKLANIPFQGRMYVQSLLNMYVFQQGAYGAALGLLACFFEVWLIPGHFSQVSSTAALSHATRST